MEKKELESLRKAPLKDLLKLRQDTEDDLIRLLAQNSSKSAQKSKNIKNLKVKIAWIETLISQKPNEEVENGKD